MTTLNAPSLQTLTYSGDAPLAVAHGGITLANAQAGDKVRLNLLHAGTKVYAAKLVHAALGSGVNLDLGFVYANDEIGGDSAAFLVAANCATAGKHESNAAPVTLTHDAYLVATIAGATANGRIDSVLTYEFRGV